LFGILGDVHGNFAAMHRILERHPEIPFWLCVGDVASATGAYPEPAAPVYWIKGNNESFDRIEIFRTGAEQIPNLHYIPNGQAVRVGSLVIAGIGGTFAPTWYESAARDLPTRPKDDKRRHFVREEIEACKALAHIDVLLTHEAPKPFFVDLPSSTAPTKRWRRDVGKVPIAEAADAVKPRLHCFGHHHVHASFMRAGIPTVCVDRVNRSYLLVDSETLTWHTHRTEAA